MLLSANHLLGATGHPAPALFSTQVFTTLMSILVAAPPRCARLWAQGYGNLQHETSSSDFSFVLSPNYHVHSPT